MNSRPIVVSGQMYMHYGVHPDYRNIYVVVEPHPIHRDGWITFNISKCRFEWDSEAQFHTQYRRLA